MNTTLEVAGVFRDAVFRDGEQRFRARWERRS